MVEPVRAHKGVDVGLAGEADDAVDRRPDRRSRGHDRSPAERASDEENASRTSASRTSATRLGDGASVRGREGIASSGHEKSGEVEPPSLVIEGENAKAVLGEVPSERRPRLAVAVALVGHHGSVPTAAVDDAAQTREVDGPLRLRRRR